MTPLMERFYLDLPRDAKNLDPESAEFVTAG